MARRLRSIAIALLALPLVGMGALGGSGSAVPERNYAGTFVDRDGTRVEARWIHCGGELALSGQLGRGDVRVSFDDVKTVEFGGDPAKSLVATVTLRKGDRVELKIRSSLAFSGRTELGAYQIRARDLQSLELRSE
ncbi:MAG: hypothetical protein HYY35_09540 [Deltaproteobacteria bacterium]|nr:hypothetical protein [Deltaproteobacteria bacterium]